MTAGNLVVNGDAEAGTTAGWTAVQGALISRGYGETGYPGSVLLPDLLPFPGGSRFFHPGSNVNHTVNEQQIALPASDHEEIDAGSLRARLAAYLGGYANQNDRIGVQATWRDAAGTTVLEQQLSAVTSTERGSVSGYLARRDEQPVPPGARSVTVTLTGDRVSGGGTAHDGYVDEIDLRMVGVPRLEKAFGAAVATAGRPFRLTYAVRNSADLEAKPAWSFVDVLPDGVRVAAMAGATSDCPAARISVAGGRVSVGGAVPAGQGDCTASLDVVADPGRHVTGAKQLEDVVGLRVGAFTEAAVAVEPAGPGPVDPEPPVDPGPGTTLPPVEIPPFVPPPPPPPPPPRPVDPWLPSFVRPALRASFAVDGGGQRRAGDRVGLRLRVANPTDATASRVRVCVSLPSALRLEAPTARAVRSGKAKPRVARSRAARPCWVVGTVAGDAEWETTLDVRVVRSTGSTVRARATVTSPDTVARASATAKLRIADDEDDDREDGDARRR